MAENSGAEPNNRGPGRPFPKGTSGNPGGRPQKLRSLEAALQEAHDAPKVLAVVEKLRTMAVGGDVQAARLYLDRVMGPIRANEEQVEARAREMAETIVAGRRRHNLTLEQLDFMAANGGKLPPGVRVEYLGG